MNQQWDQSQVQTIKKKIDQDQFNAEQQRAAMFGQTQGYVTRTAHQEFIYNKTLGAILHLRASVPIFFWSVPYRMKI